MDVYYTLDASRPLARLDAIREGLGDATKEPLRAGFVRAGLLYFQDMRARFQGAMMGDGTWPALSPATIKEKHGDRRILFRTGALFNDVPPANFNRAIEINRDGVKAYLTNPVAKFHQKGGGRLPQRKVLDDARPPAQAKMIAAVREAADRAVVLAWPNVRSAG